MAEQTAPAYETYGIDNLLPGQSQAVTALIAHFNGRKPVEVASVWENHIISARWIDNSGEEILVNLDFLGRPTRVGYSILTEADKEDGVTEAEWYDCTDLDGLWEELQAALIEAGLPKPRKRRGRRAA